MLHLFYRVCSISIYSYNLQSRSPLTYADLRSNRGNDRYCKYGRQPFPSGTPYPNTFWSVPSHYSHFLSHTCSSLDGFYLFGQVWEEVQIIAQTCHLCWQSVVSSYRNACLETLHRLAIWHKRKWIGFTRQYPKGPVTATSVTCKNGFVFLLSFK